MGGYYFGGGIDDIFSIIDADTDRLEVMAKREDRERISQLDKGCQTTRNPPIENKRDGLAVE